jgi:hypothetical protein
MNLEIQVEGTLNGIVMLSSAKHLAEPWLGWAQILRCSQDDNKKRDGTL